jgi:hypothetical protein
MYKNRVSDGKNVPVSTWEFPLFWRVIFQREASFGSLFVTVRILLTKTLYLLKLPAISSNKKHRIAQEEYILYMHSKYSIQKLRSKQVHFSGG